jgi:exopolyphosphatase
VVIIVGNEAADADSIVSAIALAYLRSLVESKSPLAARQCYVPVANVSPHELCLRRDVQNLLSIIDVPIGDIICLRDVDIPLVSAKVKMNIILTDHNTAVANLKPYESVITEIWDHHNDVGSLPAVQGVARNIAYDSANAKPLVGSACTLIAESYFQCLDASLIEVDQELATLLLGVIAIDTFNMDAAMGKGTSRDAAAMIRLESHALRERNDLFKLLRDAKLDPKFWRDLSATHAFSLDYKEFSSPSTGFVSGVSSVLLSVHEFLQKPGVFEETANLLRRNNINAIVAMALETQPEAKRSLCVATLSEDLTRRYASFLTGESCAEARVAPPTHRRVALEDGSTHLFIATMDQGNTKYSRKQMADYFIKFGDTVMKSQDYA